MADNISENAVLAELVFGISGIEKQMLEIQALSNKTALTVQETFAKTNLTPGMGSPGATANDAQLVKNLTATQAKRLNILREGEVKAQTIVTESQAAQEAFIAQSYNDMAIKKMMADAQIKNRSELTNQAIIEGQNKVDLAIGESEAKKAAIVAESEAKKTLAVEKAATQRQATVLKEQQAELAAVKKSVEQQRLAYMQSRQAAFENMPTGMTGLLARHLSWFATGAVLFEGFDLLREGLVGVETGMKGLQTVLPDLAHDQQAYNEASRETIDLMQKLGSNLDDTMTAARSLGRMYKDVDTVMGLTNNSILLNVIDQVSLENAVKGNEVALATYGDTLKSTNEVLAFSGHLMDSITNLSHNTLATGTDLVNILQQTSSAAKQAGTDLDQLLGVGSAAIRATGLQGQGGNIGRALRTIFTQLSAPTGAVEKEISDIGVSMRKTNGELRSAYDILLDISLATKDATLSQEELNEALLKASSGKFQYNKLSALVGQFDDIIKNTAMSINSQGQTLEMAGQQLDTISRKAGMLKATLIDTFSGAGDSGLREAIKGLIDVVNQFMMGLNKVSPAMINGGLAIGAVVVVWKTLSKVWETLLPLATNLTLMTRGLTLAQSQQAIATAGLAKVTTLTRQELLALEGVEIATARTTGVLTGAFNALKVAFATNPIGLVITGLTTLAGVALTAYTYQAGQAEKAQLDLNQAQKENMAILQQEISQRDQEISFLQSMKEKHKQLTDQLNSGNLTAEELAETKRDLNAIEEAVGLTVDEAAKKRMEAIGIENDEIDKIIELVNAEKSEEQFQLGSQIRKSKSAIEGAEARMAAYNAEINTINALGALKDPMDWSFTEAAGNFIKTINPFNSFNKEFDQLSPENQKKYLEDQRKAVQKTIDDNKALLQDARMTLAEMMSDGVGTPTFGNGSSAGEGNEYTSSEKMAAIIGKWTDNLETADEATWQYGIAIQELATKQDILNSEIGDSIMTLEQQQAALANFTEQSEQHRLTQEALHEVNEENRAAMAGLDGEIEAATAQYGKYASETQKLVKAKEDLEKQTRQNSKEWWVEQAAIVSLSKSMQELQEDTAAKTYQSERDTMQHRVSLAQMTTEQQIKELMRMKDTYLLTVKETWEIDEQLYSLRKKLLQEYLDELEDEYNDKLERIDNRTDRTVARLQAKIDALEDKGTDNERERAEADHLKKIAELEEARYKETLRTGYEHDLAIIDYDKQIADEEESWRRQQEDWALDDKKSALQDEIDAVKEAADEERKELKKHYEKAQAMAENSMDDIVNAIGEREIDFETTGKSLVDALIEGMMSGDFSEWYDMLDDLTDSASSAKSSSSKTTSGSSAAKKKAQATEDANEARKALIAAGYAQGAADISSHDAKGAAEWYAQYIVGRTDLSSTVKKLFLKIANAKQAWEDADNAHTGAFVKEGGLAVLKHDERVLSPNLTQSFGDLVAALTLPDVTSRISGSGTSEAAITEATNRIINAISQQRVIAVDKMLNVENANMGSSDGIQDVTEILRRQVNLIAGAKG